MRNFVSYRRDALRTRAIPAFDHGSGPNALPHPQGLIIFLALVATIYNGILAFFAARGVPVNSTLIGLVEIGILMCSGVIIIKDRFEYGVLPAFSLLYFMILIGVTISLINETIFFNGIRNFLIVTIFTLLGAHCKFSTLTKIFRIAALVVLFGLLFEIIDIGWFTKFFQPASYLSATRGMAESKYSNGLSAGTIAYQGRFSLGLYSGPRTSSIFLEQVSINCFTIVLELFLLVFIKSLKRFDIALYITVIILILATNNARMGMLVGLIYIAGYFIFPRLPRYTTIIFMPFVIILTFILLSYTGTSSGDDLIGRLSTTYDLLVSMKASELALGNLYMLGQAADSGYAYLIYSTTLFGLIGYWLYLSFILPQSNEMSKRCAWGLVIYVGIWLLVGGTGSFSMKTAPLLWLIVGYVRQQSFDDKSPSPQLR
ncbi:hypothetical protein [Sphingobium sp. BS19]|uniref:hypothetical protein n=1 Tax=Sphingobium sp. BS19 TaxID=3018973 RepID=UPI0024901D17|nr:hypothetical protein [Sphingobium sp. BS19]